jgi:N-acetyl-gamma-glutamyl-phosphate reductase
LDKEVEQTMKIKVFVDGQEGTTGLEINQRLAQREDIEILNIAPEKRKDPAARSVLINKADFVFLCLPDAAAKESVSLATNEKVRIIDASTAHRCDDSWTYGLPELCKAQREAIKTSKRVAVPGCYATGFNIAVYPLVKLGILPADYPISSFAISGHSGGGKKLIQKYKDGDFGINDMNSPQMYALGLAHKHLPEMKKISGLVQAPVFNPMVGNFYRGMVVSVPLVKKNLAKQMTASEIHGVMADYYKDEKFVKVIPFDSSEYLNGGFLDATGCNNTNNLEVFVFGNDDQILVASRLDNLGKGASGAAVQDLNIMMGVDEGKGLE